MCTLHIIDKTPLWLTLADTGDATLSLRVLLRWSAPVTDTDAAAEGELSSTSGWISEQERRRSAKDPGTFLRGGSEEHAQLLKIIVYHPVVIRFLETIIYLFLTTCRQSTKELLMVHKIEKMSRFSSVFAFFYLRIKLTHLLFRKICICLFLSTYGWIAFFYHHNGIRSRSLMHHLWRS